MTEAEDLRRGAEARALLAHPLLTEAFHLIEQRLIGEIKKIGTNRDKAEELRQVLIGLDKFRGYLNQVVSTGRMAEFEEAQKKMGLGRATYEALFGK